MFDRVLTDSREIRAEVERRRQGKQINGEFRFDLSLSPGGRVALGHHLAESASAARSGYAMGGRVEATEQLLTVLDQIAAAAATDGAQAVRVDLRSPQCEAIRRVLKASETRAGDASWSHALVALVASWEKFYGWSDAAEAEAAGRPPRAAADTGGWVAR